MLKLWVHSSRKTHRAGHQFLIIGLLAGWGLLGLACGEVSADLVRLQAGGELRGKIVEQGKSSEALISVQTVAGALITVAQSDVDFVTRRPLVYEEYETRSRLAPDTVEGQWALAEWCLEQRLTSHRETHLERILDLDPDNASAHKSLGHVLRNGEWTTHEQEMLSRGYVKYRGRFITPEEKELAESTLAERQQQLAWFEKIKIWSNWLTGRYEQQRQQAVGHFRQIQDPYAIPALQNFLAEQPARDVRLLYIQTLGQINDPAAVHELVRMGVLDGDRGVRQQAVGTIPQPSMDQAAQELVSYLNHTDNQVIRRAATALKEIGTLKAVPPLIEALVTNHKYRVATDVPRIGMTSSAGGIGAVGQPPLLPPELEAGLRMGLIPPENVINNRPSVKQLTTVRVAQQNPEVLEALKEITQADFGYDKRTWKLWWMSQKS